MLPLFTVFEHSVAINRSLKGKPKENRTAMAARAAVMTTTPLTAGISTKREIHLAFQDRMARQLDGERCS